MVKPQESTANGRLKDCLYSRAIWSRVALVLVVAIVAVQVGRVAAADFRTGPPVGDQSSHLFQALSIVEQGNLSFDNGDIEAWVELDWTPTPRAIFYQKYDQGFALAKPYGYSAWLAPFILVFGVVRGVAIANAALQLALLAVSFAIVRRRFDPLTSALTASVFVLGSSAYFFGYVIHPDVFLAVLTACIGYSTLRLDADRKLKWAVVTGSVTGFAISEKPTLMALYGIVIGVALYRSRSVRLAAVTALSFLATFAVAIIPYLKYSSFKSWNAYAGERFISVTGEVPFDSTPGLVEAISLSTSGYFTPSFWLDRLGKDGAEILQSGVYSAVGRHTGMLPFMSLAFCILILAFYRRRSEWTLGGASIVAGLGAYMTFYVVFFPFNYFGGSQTFGNRYLLQVVPITLLLLAHLEIKRKHLLITVALASVLSLLFLGPHHRDPSNGYWMIDRTSLAQQYLPFEFDREGANGFACPARISREGALSAVYIYQNGSELCHELLNIVTERVVISSG